MNSDMCNEELVLKKISLGLGGEREPFCLGLLGAKKKKYLLVICKHFYYGFGSQGYWNP